MRHLLPHLLACLALLLATATAHAEVSVSMTARPTSVRVGDQLMLKIEISTDGLSGPQIQLPNLDDFEVVQKSVSRPMQFSFGTGGRNVRSSSHYKFVLRALEPGTFTLGPTEVRGGGKRYRSRAVQVTVTGPTGQAAPTQTPQSPQPGAAQPAPQGGTPPRDAAATATTAYVDGAQTDPQAFIRTVVDKPKPFVHEQVTVTIYLYTRDRLRAAPSIDTEPTTDGLWTRELLETSKVEQVGRQRVNGKRYNVYVLRRFAAFPLKPGPLTIGPLGLSIPRGNVFDLFSGRQPAEGLKRMGVPVELDVQPLPEGGPPAAKVAVGAFTIEAKLDRSQLATGDAATLTATVRGHGQLTTLRLDKPVVDGLEVFDPQIKDLLEAPKDLVGGTRIYEWLVVPQRPGHYTIPAFVVPTFDARRRAYGTARSAPLSLTAAGKAAAAGTPTTAAPARAEDTARAADDAQALQLAPIRNHSKLSQRVPPLSATASYPYLVASAPIAWLLMLLVGWSRRRLAAAGRDPAGRASRAIRTHLADASRAATAGEATAVHAGVAAALHAALEQALGEPIGSHTRSDLSRLMRARSIDTGLETRVVELLEHCDVARFSVGGSSQQSLQQTVDTARGLIAELGRAGRPGGPR